MQLRQLSGKQKEKRWRVTRLAELHVANQCQRLDAGAAGRAAIDRRCVARQALADGLTHFRPTICFIELFAASPRRPPTHDRHDDQVRK